MNHGSVNGKCKCDPCREAWTRYYRRYRGYPELEHRTLQCAWCGTSFLTSRADRRYCSDRCKVANQGAIRRARTSGAVGTFTWVEVTRAWMGMGRACAYCCTPTTDYQPDHVHPLSRGGSNSITNILPVCAACNSSKDRLLLAEWAAKKASRLITPLPWISNPKSYRYLVTPLPRVAAAA